MKVIGTLKQSDTFKVDIVLADNGVPYNLTGAVITSRVENADETFVFQLLVTITNAALGQFTVEGQTPTWPVGNLLWDVRLTIGTFSWSLPTHAVSVEEKVS